MSDAESGSYAYIDGHAQGGEYSPWKVYSDYVLVPSGTAVLYPQIGLTELILFDLEPGLSKRELRRKVRDEGLEAIKMYSMQGLIGEREVAESVQYLLQGKTTKATEKLLTSLAIPDLDLDMKISIYVLLCKIGVIEDRVLRECLVIPGLSHRSLSLLHEHWAVTALSEVRLDRAKPHLNYMLEHVDAQTKPLHHLFARIALAQQGGEFETIALYEAEQWGDLVPRGWNEALGCGFQHLD